MEAELAKQQLPERVRTVLWALRDGLTGVLGKDVVGIYVYGALTFAEAADTAVDVDFHVLLRGPLTHVQRKAINEIQERLAQEDPLGRELDGYYLLVDSARGAPPPSDQLRAGVRDDSWALHRAHILAGHVITLVGPDPSTIYRPPSWEELDAALQWELSFVRDRLDESPAYCVLNLCRLVYSYATRDVVVSKPASGQWARHELPSQWRSLIDSALRVYAGTATAGDLQWLRAQAESFCSFAEERIVAAPHRPNSARFDWSLSNGTVRLRPLDASDAAAHLAGEDEQQVRWMGGGRRSTLATVKAWIERNERTWREGGSRYNFGIWDEPSGQLAGNVEANLADPDLEPNEANISYVVFPAWHGRQYATQAVELICQWLAAGRTHTAVIKVDPANTASIRVAERAGFSRTREIITTDGQRMTRLERSLRPTQGR